jgi:quinol monooxygenase YgiN
MMWEGFWTRSIFWNSSADKNTTMFLGEFVLTEHERSHVFARLLSLLNHQASKTTKTPNWASIKTVSKSLSSHKKHLKEKVMERWIDVFQHLLRSPDITTTTTPMTTSVEYFENFGWIDEEHIREHGQQDRYPQYVRTACQKLADVFRDMLKRNLFLLISSSLAYEDNQSRCLDHLSFLDLDKSYPDLYAFR